MRSPNHLVLIVHCKNEFEKWRAIRACVGGVLAWVACYSCLRGWHASVGDVDGVLAWLVC